VIKIIKNKINEGIKDLYHSSKYFDLFVLQPKYHHIVDLLSLKALRD